MKVELFVPPLREHKEFDLFVSGYRLKAFVYMGSEVIAEIELEYVDKKRVRLIINQLEYLIARAKRSPC